MKGRSKDSSPDDAQQPHVIRLRGPWDLQLLTRVSRDASGKLCEEAIRSGPQRVSVPGDWAAALGADFFGTARYTRRFNRPTNLGPHERVWLVAAGVSGAGVFTLNGQPLFTLSGSARDEADITALLQTYNLLAVEVTLPPETDAASSTSVARVGGLTGEVWLEIRQA